MLFKLCDKMSQLPNPQVMPCFVTIPSALFDKRSLVPTCLVSTPSWMYNFHHPCLLASSLPVLLCTPANDNRSSGPALLFILSQWHKVFSTKYQSLMVPHLPYGATHALWHPISLFGTPHASWHPICLTTLHMHYGAPSTLWHPICPMAPHLPFLAPLCLFDAHICLLAPHLPFASPICLLAPQLFLKRPMTKCLAAKRGPGFWFPGCNFWMTSLSCATTNQLYQLLLQFCRIFPTCQDVPWSESSFCLGT